MDVEYKNARIFVLRHAASWIDDLEGTDLMLDANAEFVAYLVGMLAN